jgi:hypothetical protein
VPSPMVMTFDGVATQVKVRKGASYNVFIEKPTSKVMKSKGVFNGNTLSASSTVRNPT